MTGMRPDRARRPIVWTGVAMILMLAASCRDHGERKLFQLAASSEWGFYF